MSFASLEEIGPWEEAVTLRGRTFSVPGVSLGAILKLMGRFPQLQNLANGKGLEAAELFELGGDAVGALIAAGLGHAGDAKIEEVAGRLPLGDQLALLDAIKRVTMPEGPETFFLQLSRLLGITPGSASANEPAPNGSEPAATASESPASSPAQPTN